MEDLVGEVLDGFLSVSSISESSSVVFLLFVRLMENGVLGRSGLVVEVMCEDFNDDG